MARSTLSPRDSHIGPNSVLVARCYDPRSDLAAANAHAERSYAAEIERYEDSRAFRATNALMRTNRAHFLA